MEESRSSNLESLKLTLRFSAQRPLPWRLQTQRPPLTYSLFFISYYHTHTTTHQHSQYCETGEPSFVIATILNPHIKFISRLLKVGRIKLSWVKSESEYYGCYGWSYQQPSILPFFFQGLKSHRSLIVSIFLHIILPYTQQHINIHNIVRLENLLLLLPLSSILI